MSQVSHIEALKAKHSALENAIEKENHRPHPDELVVAELKKEKLRIKDELSHFEDA